MKFNWLDIVFMALAARGLVVGIKRGIFGELVFSLVVLASIFIGIFFGPLAANVMSEHIPLGVTISEKGAAWFIVIIGILLAFLLGKIVQKLSHLFIQSSFDKVIGGLLGAIRAALLTAIIVAVLMVPSEMFQRHVFDSVVGAYTSSKLTEIHDVIKQKISSESIVKIEEQVIGTEETAEEVNVDESK